MEKATLVAKYAQTEEDKLVLSRVLDRICQGVARQIPTATEFLTARERILAEQMLQAADMGPVRFSGGWEDAERTACCYIPDYLDAEQYLEEAGPVCLIRATFRADRPLSHRDFLGSLMGCGIRRETVGDIYVDQQSCDFFVLRKIVPYLMQNLTEAGRTKLHLELKPMAELRRPPVQLEQLRQTVSSLRLDSVAAAGFHLSRSQAAELIAHGKAVVNHMACEKPDRTVTQGDVISIRGLGKLRLELVGGQTKKGRLSIEIARYI